MRGWLLTKTFHCTKIYCTFILLLSLGFVSKLCCFASGNPFFEPEGIVGLLYSIIARNIKYKNNRVIVTFVKLVPILYWALYWHTGVYYINTNFTALYTVNVSTQLVNELTWLALFRGLTPFWLVFTLPRPRTGFPATRPRNCLIPFPVFWRFSFCFCFLLSLIMSSKNNKRYTCTYM